MAVERGLFPLVAVMLAPREGSAEATFAAQAMNQGGSMLFGLGARASYSDRKGNVSRQASFLGVGESPLL